MIPGRQNFRPDAVLICMLIAIFTISFNEVKAQNLTGKLAYSRVLIDRGTSPTNEFIFPTVIRASDHIANPLGTYYMYYAPHDAPGGIYMAYSNSISGPYTAYSGNPIVSRTHQGKFNVSHVSSPHVVWMPQYNKYFMYFHGENTATRWASSTNGITWDVANDNVALRAADWGTSFTECSYAKVYEYTIPGVGNRYTMVMMLIRSGFGRRIGLATSNDGKKFTPRDEALVSQGPGEGSDLGAPAYWVNNGRHYIVYHAASGNIHSTEVGSGFNLENHQGIFFDPNSSFPEFDKAADPFLFYADNRWNMFYTVGPRLNQTIAFAFEVPSHDIVVDNTSTAFSFGGSWVTSSSTEGFYGSNYLSDNGSAADVGDWAKWKPDFPATGYYKVMVRWPALSNRPDNIKYKIYSQGVTTEVFRNQQTENGSWVYLGRFYFASGTSENNKLTIDAGSDTGYTIADAARFIFDDQTAGRRPTDEIEMLTVNDQVDPGMEKITVYPNPVRNSLAFSGDIENVKEITILNMQGLELSHFIPYKQELDISALDPGLYIMSVKTKDGVTQLRFKKE